MKKKVKKLTVFQAFANWLAINAGERDQKFEVTASERAFVVVRIKLKKVK